MRALLLLLALSETAHADGRPELIVAGTALGGRLGFAAGTLDDVSIGAQVGLMVGGGVLGFAGSWWVTGAHDFGGGAAEGLIVGGLAGMTHGLAFDNQGLALGGLFAGAVAGGWLGHGESRGASRGVGLLGASGLLSAALIFPLVDIDTATDTTVALGLLAGLDLGLAAGFFLDEDDAWRIGRVGAAEVIGAVAGAGLGVLASTAAGDDDLAVPLVAGAGLAGLWAGFGVGWWLSAEPSATPASQVVLAPFCSEGRRGVSLAGSF